MEDSPTNYADQRRASAEGDIVARDKVTRTSHHYAERRSQIDGWLERLDQEMRGDPRTATLVDNLQYFFQPFPYDEHIGLVAKLDKAGRGAQKKIALRKKESFSKLLEEWRSYPAAQEIIAYFLTKIEAAFETQLIPMLQNSTVADIDIIVKDQLIDPVLNEMSCGPFMLNYNHVAGMVYWLAEQCYIRWHQ